MIIALTFILFTIGLCMAAAVSDFLYLKIPNILSGLILGMFICTSLVDQIMDLGLFDNLTSNIIVGVVTFIIMLVCFFMGLFGGGDAKMIAALSFWMGLSGLPVFLIVMTLSGAVLAVTSIILRKTKIGQAVLSRLNSHEKLHHGWVGAMVHEKNALPYGIAITVGAMIGFRATGLLP